MSREYGEQPASATPTLDAILAAIKPPIIRIAISITREMDIFKKPYERLTQKLQRGSLTQADIEKELNNMPDVGGAEYAKQLLVESIIIELPNHNIKKLPVE